MGDAGFKASFTFADADTLWSPKNLKEVGGLSIVPEVEGPYSRGNPVILFSDAGGLADAVDQDFCWDRFPRSTGIMTFIGAI